MNGSRCWEAGAVNDGDHFSSTGCAAWFCLSQQVRVASRSLLFTPMPQLLATPIQTRIPIGLAHLIPDQIRPLYSNLNQPRSKNPSTQQPPIAHHRRPSDHPSHPRKSGTNRTNRRQSQATSLQPSNPISTAHHAVPKRNHPHMLSRRRILHRLRMVVVQFLPPRNRCAGY